MHKRSNVRILSAAACVLLGTSNVSTATSSGHDAGQVGSTLNLAQVPAQVRTTAGFYRMMLGQFEVTVLSDGTVSIPLNKLLTHTDGTQVNSLLQRAGIDPGQAETSINAFLIHTGSRLVLIDAGAGNVFGSKGGGLLLQSLRSAGYVPEDVTDVLLTHIHADHSGGLTVDGKAVFPKATLHVREEEAAFWLSSDNEVKSAPRHAHAFDQARKDLEPYRTSNRVKTFAGNDVIIPGIQALAAPGHTPGHTLFEIKSGTHKLMLWGDLIHAKDVQFASPSVTIQYDVDEDGAAKQREAALADASTNGYLVGAAHISFPGIGRVQAEGNSFAWAPVNYGEKGLRRINH